MQEKIELEQIFCIEDLGYRRNLENCEEGMVGRGELRVDDDSWREPGTTISGMLDGKPVSEPDASEKERK